MVVVIIVGVLVSVVGFQSGCEAKTLLVPEDYSDVNTAVREATYGDTILVYPGKYHVQSRLRSGVKLLSAEGPDSTVLWNKRWYGLKLLDCDLETQVSGFTFEGKGSNVCLACTTGAPVITDNVIRDSWDGINLYMCNAFIQGNKISGCNRGIYMDYSDPEVIENELTGNGDAIYMVSCAPVIARCKFEHNSRAILIHGHSYPTIGGSLTTANDILKNGFTVYNVGLRIEGSNYTDQNEIAVATHNYWGSDCPQETRLRGEVAITPWTDADHDTLYEDCPEAPVAEEEGSE
jgi:parallel beta-helix repeat protein